jgi:hypothetical protein
MVNSNNFFRQEYAALQALDEGIKSAYHYDIAVSDINAEVRYLNGAYKVTIWRVDPGAKPKCQKCNGCGKIANSQQQEPWTYWENLPVKNAIAIISGIVKPIECPTCKGTGYAP